MPLPFSFSAQRQAPEVEMPGANSGVHTSEKVMSYAPGIINTEPLMPGVFEGNLASSGAVQPCLESGQPAFGAPPINQRLSIGQNDVALAPSATLQLPFAPAGQPIVGSPGQDWGGQLEQLRNDVFGIAMSVSALTDRLDRLEQRTPQHGQSMQEGVAALRGEIQAWLEGHLNVAVERCMQRILHHAPNSH